MVRTLFGRRFEIQVHEQIIIVLSRGVPVIIVSVFCLRFLRQHVRQPLGTALRPARSEGSDLLMASVDGHHPHPKSGHHSMCRMSGCGNHVCMPRPADQKPPCSNESAISNRRCRVRCCNSQACVSAHRPHPLSPAHGRAPTGVWVRPA